MKKKKDLLDLVFDNAALGGGVMLGTGLLGKLDESIPSSASGRVLKASEMMGVLPLVHAGGALFKSMDDVYRMVKKRNKR